MLSAAQDTSCNIYKLKPDDEFRSHVDSDSLSFSGSELSCSIPIPDRKARHNIIERNRRDKTRLLIEQLQGLLPNIPDRQHNPNVNHVLQQTLDFLHSTENQSGGEAHESNADQIKIHLADIMTSKIDDIASRKYLFSFDNAPFGIVISRTNGTLLRTNIFFRNLICFLHESLEGQTMFTLTSNKDLAITMQVLRPAACSRPSLPRFGRGLIELQPTVHSRASRHPCPALSQSHCPWQAAAVLLSGDAPRLSLVKEYVRPDGRGTGPLRVDMTCVWRHQRC
jgi:hypothetical protein